MNTKERISKISHQILYHYFNLASTLCACQTELYNVKANPIGFNRSNANSFNHRLHMFWVQHQTSVAVEAPQSPCGYPPSTVVTYDRTTAENSTLEPVYEDGVLPQQLSRVSFTYLCQIQHSHWVQFRTSVSLQFRTSAAGRTGDYFWLVGFPETAILWGPGPGHPSPSCATNQLLLAMSCSLPCMRTGLQSDPQRTPIRDLRCTMQPSPSAVK
jgi:hypothetical protein